MLSVQEYLTSDFEGDREYVDGELIERHTGERPHGRTQGRLFAFLLLREASQPHAFSRSGRVRCPGFWPQRADRTPCALPGSTKPPPATSRWARGYVWVPDPETKRAFCYTPGEMHEVLDGVLRTQHPNIEVPLAAVFKEALEA
jgi:hypothetical protein